MINNKLSNKRTQSPENLPSNVFSCKECTYLSKKNEVTNGHACNKMKDWKLKVSPPLCMQLISRLVLTVQKQLIDLLKIKERYLLGKEVRHCSLEFHQDSIWIRSTYMTFKITAHDQSSESCVAAQKLPLLIHFGSCVKGRTLV